ncbi:ATP-binding protein [Rhizobium herbae]
MQIPNTVTTLALVFTPQGRDADVANRLLGEIGITCAIASDLPQFAQSLNDDTCFAVVTEEALRFSDLRPITSWINNQPSWSDLPFIILTHRGGGPERNPMAARLSELLGNVTFLERPFNAVTFVSVARTAIKGRRRQYEARTRIEDLREGEWRLQTALLAGRLGTWELELDSMTFAASDTCKAIFGRPAKNDFSYEEALASIHGDDKERVLNAVKESINSGRDYAIDHRTLWPDGSVHWTEIRARVVKGKGGHPERLVGVSSDITDRKRYEDRLRDLNDTLEERVAQRTAELSRAHDTLLAEVAQRERAEEHLRHAQKMEAIGQLTGGVAHDFNNLLMAIMGNLDLLKKHLVDNQKAARLLEGAMQGAHRGAALTQRLLAFARRQDLQVEPVDLEKLICSMTDLLERSVGSSIALRLNFSNGLPHALVDGNQVELALLNLAVNARDAMPDGGSLVVELDLAQSMPEDSLALGSYLRISFTDTGHGMDGETLKKAIDPFFSTKELGKGTGLGLSMIHGLAVQLNGKFQLFSAPGHGTRAEIWFPSTTQKIEDKEMDVTRTEPSMTAKVKILVVDDDALIAMSTVDMLEDLGHEVLEANSGARALDFLRAGDQIDLMITDYSMPGMNGAQLAKAALEINPALPILVATGYADLPPGAGIDLPRLGKPYTQDQLALEIAKVLKS